MATFGYTTAGASSMTSGHANKYTSPSAITSTDSISFYAVMPGGPPSEVVNGSIYTVSGGVYVANSVGSKTMTTSTPGWQTTTYGTKPTLSTSTDYYLVVADTQYPWCNLYYDSTAGVHDYYGNAVPPSTPQTFTDSGSDRQFSIYATYTAGGGDTVQTKDITGKGRITVSTVRTISGTAHIDPAYTTTTKTITGLARINKSVLKTITGVAKILVNVNQNKTTTGKARIQKSVNQTINGKANIIVTTNTPQTITGVARIAKNSKSNYLRFK